MPQPSQPLAAERVLRVTGPALSHLPNSLRLTPVKLSGREAINELFEYQLLLQTPDTDGLRGAVGANLALNEFIGREVTCQIELEGHGHFVAGLAGSLGVANQGAGVRELSALVTQARFLGVDSRHALYELTLRPWLYLASLSTDCKVFQDQTPVQVIQAVLADYPFACELRLLETYPVRDYCVQYNETDLQFIRRLMQEWGINHHFEHSTGVHRLILSDHNGAFKPFQIDEPQSAYHRIAYHPPGHKIDQEYIHAFTPVQRLTSGAYASREYDYSTPKAQLQARASEPGSTGQAQQDVFLWRGAQVIGDDQQAVLAASDYSQPNAGAQSHAAQDSINADSNTHHQPNTPEAQGQQLARLRLQALKQASQRAEGAGHIRGIVAGHSFQLQHHPHRAANTEYLTLSTELLIENVSEDTARASSAESPDALLSGQWQIHTRFEVQPSNVPLCPQAHQPKPHTHGPETAIVCGPDADTAESNLYTDALGRIKVQFPWDRYGQHNAHSSCWVRVSSAWAGNQLGAMHLPRVGQEVLIDFLGGDPDLPVCTGRLYHQEQLPPWQLPEQQALSGFRSRELKAGGGNSAAGRSNHLVLDDTEQKIQAQLKSDHQHSSLSLGHIARVEDHRGRQDERGQGFELRTDGHGVLRAKQGLVLTTHGRDKAQGHITDLSETTQRLDRAQSQHEAMAQLAQQHEAQGAEDQGEVATQLQAQHAEIAGKGRVTEARALPPTQSTHASEGEKLGNNERNDKNYKKFPELQAPHLVLSSPVGIESSTAQSTHQHSGQHHAVTTGGHTSLSAGKSVLASAKEAIKLFAYRSGMRLVSAVADIDIQALQKSIQILAKLNIQQEANRITLTAREEIVINGGGSYSRFNAAGIEEGTRGTWLTRAIHHRLAGPQNAPLQAPTETHAFNEMLELRDTQGRPTPNYAYRLQLANGRTVQGVTDHKGQTLRAGSGESATGVRMNSMKGDQA